MNRLLLALLVASVVLNALLLGRTQPAPEREDPARPATVGGEAAANPGLEPPAVPSRVSREERRELKRLRAFVASRPAVAVSAGGSWSAAFRSLAGLAPERREEAVEDLADAFRSLAPTEEDKALRALVQALGSARDEATSVSLLLFMMNGGIQIPDPLLPTEAWLDDLRDAGGARSAALAWALASTAGEDVIWGRAVANGVRELQEPHALVAMAWLVKSAHADNRRLGVQALAQRIIDSPRGMVRQRLLRVLADLPPGGPEGHPVIAVWTRATGALRSEAMRALATVVVRSWKDTGLRERVRVSLLSMMDEASDSVRRQLIRATASNLGLLDGPGGGDFLRALAEREPDPVRSEAIRIATGHLPADPHAARRALATIR